MVGDEALKVFLDGMITALIGTHDLKRQGPLPNSRAVSNYIPMLPVGDFVQRRAFRRLELSAEGVGNR